MDCAVRIALSPAALQVDAGAAAATPAADTAAPYAVPCAMVAVPFTSTVISTVRLLALCLMSADVGGCLCQPGTEPPPPP